MESMSRLLKKQVLKINKGVDDLLGFKKAIENSQSINQYVIIKYGLYLYNINLKFYNIEIVYLYIIYISKIIKLIVVF